MDIPIRHQQLIAKLRARGLVAEFRRWAMGDTISVADRVVVLDNGLESYDRDLYLYPAGEHSWIINTGLIIGGNCQSPPIAEAEILDHVQRLLSSQEEYERESKHWFAENRWHSVTKRRCHSCGSLCPENYATCRVCGFNMGRTTA